MCRTTELPWDTGSPPAIPHAIEGLVVQNGNAYSEGISPAFEPLYPFWANRTLQTEAPVRTMLAPETTRFQYTHGVADSSRINPDTYTFDQWILDRPGNDAIQLDLFHDYQSNPKLYPAWQRYFRDHQPPALIVWGKNDPFFTEAGARAYLRDLPDAELHLLDTGHFALEDHVDVIAARMQDFLQRAHAGRAYRFQPAD